MNRTENRLLIIWYAVLIFLITGYILLPMGVTVKEAFAIENGYGFRNFAEFFSNKNQLEVLKNTVLLGILSVVLCGIVGTVLALYVSFLADRGKRIIHTLLLCPMMIPGVIIVMAFVQLYGESGILTQAIKLIPIFKDINVQFRGLGAILFVITYTQYVYFYLNIYTALKFVDHSAMDAAKSMGAGALRIFKDVIFPVIRPAIFTSAIISFASGISAFSAPNIIGGGFKVLSTQIVHSKVNNRMDMASVQVVILFIVAISFVLLVRWYSKRYRVAINSRISPKGSDGEKKSIVKRICLAAVILQIVIILMPVVIIVYLSFIPTQNIMTMIFPTGMCLDNYREIFENIRNIKPLVNSFSMSLWAVFVGMIITVPSAWLFVRKKNILNAFIQILMMLPWTMPASVIAINLINSFNKPSVFALGNSLIGGYYIIPIAYTITFVPLLLTSSRVAAEGFDICLEEASKSLGASKIRTFLSVIIPCCASGIISGGILVFIRCIGEYTMSALLYGVYNRPISISMITNMQEYHLGVSLAYGVIVIMVCIVAMAVLFIFDRKRFM